MHPSCFNANTIKTTGSKWKIFIWLVRCKYTDWCQVCIYTVAVLETEIRRDPFSTKNFFGAPSLMINAPPPLFLANALPLCSICPLCGIYFLTTCTPFVYSQKGAYPFLHLQVICITLVFYI